MPEDLVFYFLQLLFSKFSEQPKRRLINVLNCTTKDFERTLLQNLFLNALNKAKSISLLEMFSIELKFTIDALVKWFNDVFKSRFNELDELKNKILQEKILLTGLIKNGSFAT